MQKILNRTKTLLKNILTPHFPETNFELFEM